MAAAAHTPSREQLQLAFRHYAGPHWPPTLDEALARPAYRAIIEQLARRISRPSWASHQRSTTRRPLVDVPATPEVPRTGNRAINSLATTPQRPLSVWTKPLPAHGRVDIKRLAANDRDDD